MGLLDALSGALGEVLRQARAPSQDPRMQSATEGLAAGAFPNSLSRMLASAGAGDLTGLVERLRSGGLEDQVKSWLGSGANLPVTAEQLREVLGEGRVQELARQLGLPADRIMDILAQHLPEAVDQASPNGTLPPRDENAA
jgi:uncharacterized protein YidB (DUF937 family)